MRDLRDMKYFYRQIQDHVQETENLTDKRSYAMGILGVKMLDTHVVNLCLLDNM